MNKLLTLAGAIATIACLPAQGKVCSPPGLESTEGGLYSYYFGGLQNGHYQQLFGTSELGSAPAVLKAYSVRLDYRSHSSTSTGSGRSWTNCTMHIGNGDMKSFGNTWTKNFTGTPTMCFSGSVTWASQSGYPSSKPAPWGDGGRKFPFSANYTYTGAVDVVCEFQFSGGKLANNATWGTSSTRTYYLDGFTTSSSSIYGSGPNIPTSRLNNTGGRTTCNDSAHTTSTGAYLYSQSYVYGQDYPIYNYRNAIRYYSYSYYTAPSAPVLHAVGIGRNTPGIDIFNTGCNKLHMTTVLLIDPHVTPSKAKQPSSYSGYRYYTFPYPAGGQGAEIITQGLWTDSVTGKLLLTQADTIILPALPPANDPDRLTIYNYRPTSTTGFGPYNYFYMNPAVCFDK